MGKLRFYFAMFVSKTMMFLLKLLGRNATYLPGEAAVRICKDFIGYLKKPKTLICVTGTNGKTTVSNLITGVLKTNGYSVTNNSFGSNVQAGVAAALISDSTFGGKPKKDVAVIEVDERSSLLIYPYMAPDFLVCNNIMRDSLKRNAHVEFISYIINTALPKTTKLILNGDDLVCSTLAPENKDRTYIGVDAEKPEKLPDTNVRDIVYCPKCGDKLVDDYIRYNHIGKMHCENYGFSNPERDFVVTNIDRENSFMTILHNGEEKNYRIINNNIVNIYNTCGVVALLTSFGLTYEQITKGFENLEIVKTRFDSFNVGDITVTSQLAKGQNPIACSRAFSYIAGNGQENKCLLLILDDVDDNRNNSESTCWLYDCDYSPLADDSISELIFAGERHKDQYLRAVLSGVSPEKIKTTLTAAEGAELIDTKKYKNICILHDLYRMKDKKIAEDIIRRKGEESV